MMMIVGRREIGRQAAVLTGRNPVNTSPLCSSWNWKEQHRYWTRRSLNVNFYMSSRRYTSLTINLLTHKYTLPPRHLQISEGAYWSTEIRISHLTITLPHFNAGNSG